LEHKANEHPELEQGPTLCCFAPVFGCPPESKNSCCGRQKVLHIHPCGSFDGQYPKDDRERLYVGPKAMAWSYYDRCQQNGVILPHQAHVADQNKPPSWSCDPTDGSFSLSCPPGMRGKQSVASRLLWSPATLLGRYHDGRFRAQCDRSLKNRPTDAPKVTPMAQKASPPTN